METPSAPSKILERGPDYLRRQMELESETKVGMSAVERLAMSKAKYVKSQQVISSTQEPVISIGSASVSSHGSSGWNSKGKLVSNLPLTLSSGPLQSVSPGQVRRSSSKKRPDSILLYRQKCDLLKASTSDRKRHILRKLKSKTVQESEQEQIPTPEGLTQECTVNVVAPQDEQNGAATKINKENTHLLTVPNAAEGFRRSGKGVSRSHSDISSRYSKNFADFDAFFKYCGLDGDVIETVGKENFSVHSEELEQRVRSVSLSNSDDGFSRSSGNSDGLQEDEVLEKIRQGTSVIERNARIIKWLYSCRNATETGKKLRDLE
ncbi:protein FAM110C [Eucyclogobius newberryi]|uniref:protein FAM110C n=1 Tax=Eucyclogobius newberryi TaxID=166745 RepID=UPI003B5A6C8B